MISASSHRKLKKVILAICLGATLLPAQSHGAPAALPVFVIGPPNRAGLPGFGDVCAHPDEWKATRAVTNEILCSDHRFAMYSDGDLKKWFAMLQANNIKLELEVGAIKPWGVTGEGTFKGERKMWDRIQSLGGHIASIAMDEPLCCVRRNLKKTDQYAIDETANFIAQVQQNYPDIKIVEVEPYPGAVSLADHKKWIDALQKKLAERKLNPLAAYRVDVDWIRFSALKNNGSWLEVKQLEDYCHSVKLPFSLIYWSSGYGYWQKHGMADDSTWYNGVMAQGYSFASTGAKPDQYVIESWVGAPAVMAPETGDFTFTRSALDFYRKFVGKVVRPPGS